MPAPYPAWINYSGFAAWLTNKSGGESAAWLLFKTLIDIDCRYAVSQRVDTPIDALTGPTGLTIRQIKATMEIYRELALARYYIPEEESENALIEINTPLPTPKTHRQVIAMEIPDPAIAVHRFCDCPEAREMDPNDPVLQEIIDLYLDTCSVRVNAFIVDRLKALRHRADIGAIRWAFKTTKKNNSHSLDMVERTALKIADKGNKKPWIAR